MPSARFGPEPACLGSEPTRYRRSVPSQPNRVLTEAPILATVTRGGLVESAHRASLVALDSKGRVAFSHGGIDDPLFPRSALKPLQAVAMVHAGLDLPPDELAVVCSSHSGQKFHLDAVQRILRRAGLDEAALRNTTGYPLNEYDRAKFIRKERPPTSLTQNCSGKHAGMLATCVGKGWSTKHYLDIDHKVQKRIRKTITELAGQESATWAVDGCGAPVFALTLTGLARAFAAIASASDGSDEARVAAAMRSHPVSVGGTGRDVTTLIAGTPGLIAKDGAEEVYAAALDDGRAVALKVADGSGGAGTGAAAHRARTVIMAAALRRLGVESSAYDELLRFDVLGHGKPVGSISAVGV